MTDTDTQRSRIVGFYAENIKRLTVVEINPDSDVVVLAGRNRQGKSSVLDSIWWALKGVRNIQSNPIRRGAEEAIIKVDLGTLKVTRTFKTTPDGSYTTDLKVRRVDGRAINSPQAALDALAGEISFDPLLFTRMEPREQFDVVKAFVPGVDFAGLAEADKEDYEARTVANRRAKELRAQADAIILPAGKLPARVDLGALETKLADAASTNVGIEREKTRLEGLDGAIKAHEERAASCRNRAAELRREAEEQETRGAEHEGHAKNLRDNINDSPPIADPVDVSQVQADLAAGRTANAALDRATNKERLVKDAQEQETAARRLTEAMAAREETKKSAIAKAKMPVDGLGFGDGVVLLNGQPFDQASDAEQLEAAMAIAAAMNPTLRVIRVRDGSLLDDLAMKRLESFAAANDMQVWVERVTDGSDDVGFVLEDGHLKVDDGEASQDEAPPESF